MPRVKRGMIAHKRHKNLLKLTKGYRHRRKNVYRLAKQAWLKAGEHAYRDRRRKKRVMRALWIIRLNAAVREHGLNYRDFIAGLKSANIQLNRKVLSELALTAPDEFTVVIDRVKQLATKQS